MSTPRDVLAGFPVRLPQSPVLTEIEALRRGGRTQDPRFRGAVNRAGEGRGGSTERQHARCRQLCKLAGHLYLPRHRSPVAGDSVPLQSILA